MANEARTDADNVWERHAVHRGANEEPDLLYGESIADLVSTSCAGALPLAAPKVSSNKGDPA